MSADTTRSASSELPFLQEIGQPHQLHHITPPHHHSLLDDELLTLSIHRDYKGALHHINSPADSPYAIYNRCMLSVGREHHLKHVQTKGGELSAAIKQAFIEDRQHNRVSDPIDDEMSSKDQSFDKSSTSNWSQQNSGKQQVVDSAGGLDSPQLPGHIPNKAELNEWDVMKTRGQTANFIPREENRVPVDHTDPKYFTTHTF